MYPNPKIEETAVGTVPEVEAFVKKDFLGPLFVVGVGARKESPRAEPEAEEKWAKAVPWSLGRETAA